MRRLGTIAVVAALSVTGWGSLPDGLAAPTRVRHVCTMTGTWDADFWWNGSGYSYETSFDASGVCVDANLVPVATVSASHEGFGFSGGDSGSDAFLESRKRLPVGVTSVTPVSGAARSSCLVWLRIDATNAGDVALYNVFECGGRDGGGERRGIAAVKFPDPLDQRLVVELVAAWP
jgi:hypothetical protein